MDHRIDSLEDQGQLASGSLRHHWSVDEVMVMFDQPFMDLVFRAQTVHRDHFVPNEIQISRLLSIKTGACPEDCNYCPQSAHFDTGLEKERLMQLEAVIAEAKAAKESGASRFCMGAAWRGPNKHDFETTLAMIEGVKALGLETCASFGLLNAEQARQLKDVGLDYYNHNVDTSEKHYEKIITTRTYEDRLKTLDHVREAGMNICCGGIVGLGEEQVDRADMLVTLANLPQPPESVPINLLIATPGTPLEQAGTVDPFDFVRTIAVARILMPTAYVRLSAGREQMTDELQALCFLAGANSIFSGDKLLTAKNASPERDAQLFDRLGLKPEGLE